MPTVLTASHPTPIPSMSMSPSPVDPVRASVGHLLSRACSEPCLTAANAFTQLVQPTSRFQLALDVLLPRLEPDGSAELAQRILVSFILYSLYAPHPISINPFKSMLYIIFVKERENAINVAKSGGVSPNEQLVWVLWKILKGDGNDIGPYSPTTLARSPLPPKLRAINLSLDEEIYRNDYDIDEYFLYSRTANSASGNAMNGNSTTGSHSARFVTPEEDMKNDSAAQAMRLLLAARERVLSLSEQRLVTPFISDLAASQMVTPLDLAPIISHNPSLAYPLLVALLSIGLPGLTASATEADLPSPLLDVLTLLPPTLPTFDLMGRLLRDTTPVGGSQVPIWAIVKTEVLGRFVHECITWLDNAEKDEREGLISDDRFAKGVQNLCRFYHSLIKLSLVNPSLDADFAEMAHFSLRNSRFEEANALYRALAMGNF